MTDAETELRASRIGEPCKASPKSRSRNRDAVDRRRGSDLLEPRFEESVSLSHLTGRPNLGLWNRSQTSGRTSEPNSVV
jgi:hypothetical protein